MESIKVKVIAFSEAKQEYYEFGKKKFMDYIPDLEGQIEFVEECPEVIFVLSGGSEQSAKQTVNPEQFYILVSHEEDNSNAAAFEIKAYLNQRGISSVLLTNQKEITEYLEKYAEIKLALTKLKGKKLGLIGNVSEWLIASDIEEENLLQKIGINLIQIDWKNMLSLEKAKVDSEFMEKYDYKDAIEIENASKIYHILNECVKKEHLDAITVECFPLVRQKAVTACLALSHFNDRNIPAGCEGDLASAVGMMLLKEVCGTIPWMANVARIDKKSTLFAHCTIGTDLLSDCEITTHFETGLGTAIQGKYRYDDITIFRLDNRLTKAMVTTGKVLNRPKYSTACRTQIEVKIEDHGFEKLKNNPLGNHHLILPGNQTENINLACKMLGIEMV